MEPAEVDFQALAEQLMGENEGLRETVALLKLRKPRMLDAITSADIRAVASSKLFWGGFLIGIIFALAYGLVPLITINAKQK